MASCTCYMFINKGNCWHTGYRPTFHDEVKSEPKYVFRDPYFKWDEPPPPIRASRTRPRAVTRMFDYLDLCEQLKPGSSGLDGTWH